MKKQRLFYFNLQNNTGANVPMSILNGDQPDSIVNAVTRYRWDITGLSFADPSFTFLARTIYQTSYTTYTGTAASAAALITALNALHVGTFWLITDSGNTYVETYNDKMVYGNLIIGTISSAFSLSFNAAVALDSLDFTLDGSGTIFGLIDYGDGNIEGFSQAGPVNFSHAYAAAGNYNVIVYLNDATAITEFSAATTRITAISGLSNLVNLITLVLNNTLISSLDVTGNSVLDSLSVQNSALIPGLLTSLDITQNTALTELLLARHASLTAIDISQNVLLDNLSIQNCSLTAADITNNALLLTCLLSVNKLTVGAVNAILIALDGFGLLNGTCATFGQVPAAAPTGAGATAKTNLIGNGWTVTTD